MIWNDGKIISDIVLKAAFLDTKRSIEAEDIIGPWGESYELLMVKILRL